MTSKNINIVASNEYGYIDSEGNVWLTNESTEPLKVGNWVAGTPEQGISFFTKKYQDLLTELRLIHNRIVTKVNEIDFIEENLQVVSQRIDQPNFLGDLTKIKSRLTELKDILTAAKKAHQTEQEQALKEAKARKQALILKMKELIANTESNSWKKTNEIAENIFMEWKTLPRLTKEDNDSLWKTYSQLRRELEHKKTAYFRKLNEQQAQIKQIKATIIAEAQSLADSTDWNETTQKFKQLLEEWKNTGRGNRKTDDKQWSSFKESQDKFFAAKKQNYEAKLHDFQENYAKKLAFIKEKEPELTAITDQKVAKNKYNQFIDKLDAIGKISKEQLKELNAQLNDLEVKLFGKSNLTDNQPKLSIMAEKFIDRANHFKELANKAKAKGDKKAEKLALEQLKQWEKWSKTSK